MTQQNALLGDAVDDPQAEAVLAWERDFVERRVPARIMGRRQCEDLVREAAEYAGIAAPSVEYGPVPEGPCIAFPADNKILVDSWTRAQVKLLHEVAHLATWRGVCQGEAPHGPSFVTTAIRLFDRFLGIPTVLLEDKAASAGIDYLPALRPGLAYHGASA